MHKRLKNIFFNLDIRLAYRFKTKRTQVGQGMIEYLLMLVFTVSLIFAIMNGLGRPVANYMNNIYSLVGCMLRVGEGPQVAFNLCGGLGALELDQDALNTGAGGTGGPTGSGNSGNSGDDSGNDDGSSGNNSNSSDQSSNFTTPSSRGSIDGAGGRRGGGGNFNFGDGEVGQGDSNRIKLNGDEAGADGSFEFQGSNQETVIVRRIRRNGEGQIGGSFTLVDKEEAVNSGERETEAPTAAKRKAPDESELGRRKVSSFSVTPDKKRGDEGKMFEKQEGFSFMKLIKWAIIIAIIFIFGAFTLSQLNSIRKGWTE